MITKKEIPGNDPKMLAKAEAANKKPHYSASPDGDEGKTTVVALVKKGPKTTKAIKAPKEKKEPRGPTANSIIATAILGQKTSVEEIVALVKKEGKESKCPTTTKIRCVRFNLEKAGKGKNLKLFSRVKGQLIEFSKAKKAAAPAEK